MKATTFTPNKGTILVTEMDEGVHITKGGIIIQDDTGSERGIRNRWAKVAFVAEDIDYVQPGEWVLVEHGRWTTRIRLELEGQEPMDVWKVDPAAILGASDENHSHKRMTF